MTADCASNTAVMPGHDPGIHHLCKTLDRRVKPGDDSRVRRASPPLPCRRAGHHVRLRRRRVALIGDAERLDHRPPALDIARNARGELRAVERAGELAFLDRKSTRLNSSH